MQLDQILKRQCNYLHCSVILKKKKKRKENFNKFEVAETWLTQLIDWLPSLIGLYCLFDLMGTLMPGVRR